MLSMARIFMGGKEAGLDIVKMLLYRQQYFGKQYSEFLHQLLRGSSEWTVGERELFAAFTSKLNECSFCVPIHGAVAALDSDDAWISSILADWRTAPIDEKLRAMLGFLEKMALTPNELTIDDAKALRTIGLSDQQIEDAVYISACFHVINRLADSFDFTVPSPKGLKKTTKNLFKQGYRM
jgi:uncharacterized peroxidase-related enzyme